MPAGSPNTTTTQPTVQPNTQAPSQQPNQTQQYNKQYPNQQWGTQQFNQQSRQKAKEDGNLIQQYIKWSGGDKAKALQHAKDNMQSPQFIQALSNAMPNQQNQQQRKPGITETQGQGARDDGFLQNTGDAIQNVGEGIMNGIGQIGGGDA